MQVSFSLGKKPSLNVWLFQIVALEVIVIIALISTTNNLLRVLMFMIHYCAILEYWELSFSDFIVELIMCAVLYLSS